MIDTKLYAVTAPNGYRRGGLTQSEAMSHARRLLDQMQTNGWRGKVEVIYRDGTAVWTGGVGE